MMRERTAYSVVFTLLIVGTIIIMTTKFTNEGILVTLSGVFVFFYHLYCILNEAEPKYNNRGKIVQ